MAGNNGRTSMALLDLYPGAVATISNRRLQEESLVDRWPSQLPVWYDSAKQIADPLIALLVLVVLAPLYALIGLLVKCTSPGPVFYVQERIGKGGRPFKIYKFRSMCQNAEPDGPLLASFLDPRVTGWGRFMRRMRLDELPQFYNVLIGDMALVGPRPERQYYIDQIVRIAPQYKNLLSLKPGITSFGQVKFGYAQNIPEMIQRLQYDILYLHKVSPAMDLRVLLFTVKTLLQGKGH